MTPDYGMKSQVEIKQVVVTELLRRGRGMEESPIRIIRQVWSMDGLLIAEYDPQLEDKEEL